MKPAEDHWVALCDLFGGLTAFFVFTAVGIATAAGVVLAGIGDDYGGREQNEANSTITITYGSGTSFGHNRFAPSDKQKLLRICSTIPKRYEELGASMIAFISHASCRLDDDRDRIARRKLDSYDNNSTLYFEDFATNAELSARRAMAIYTFCLFETQEPVRSWFQEHQDRIIVEGRSELEAGLDLSDGEPFCKDRQRPYADEQKYRRVDIQFLTGSVTNRPPEAVHGHIDGGNN